MSQCNLSLTTEEDSAVCAHVTSSRWFKALLVPLGSRCHVGGYEITQRGLKLRPLVSISYLRVTSLHAVCSGSLAD